MAPSRARAAARSVVRHWSGASFDAERFRCSFAGPALTHRVRADCAALTERTPEWTPCTERVASIRIATTAGQQRAASGDGSRNAGAANLTDGSRTGAIDDSTSSRHSTCRSLRIPAAGRAPSLPAAVVLGFLPFALLRLVPFLVGNVLWFAVEIVAIGWVIVSRAGKPRPAAV